MDNQLTEEQLEAQGWKMASTSAGEHLKRMIDMYHELGIQTHLYRIDPAACGDCTKCFDESGEPLFKVYIKPPQ